MQVNRELVTDNPCHNPGNKLACTELYGRISRLTADQPFFVQSILNIRALMPHESVLIEKLGAEDPESEGFKAKGHGQLSSSVVRNLNNSGYDRLKVVSNDQGYYYRRLTDAEKDFLGAGL